MFMNVIWVSICPFNWNKKNFDGSLYHFYVYKSIKMYVKIGLNIWSFMNKLAIFMF